MGATCKLCKGIKANALLRASHMHVSEGALWEG